MGERAGRGKKKKLLLAFIPFRCHRPDLTVSDSSTSKPEHVSNLGGQDQQNETAIRRPTASFFEFVERAFSSSTYAYPRDVSAHKHPTEAR